jgi:hypothetical protein
MLARQITSETPETPNTVTPIVADLIARIPEPAWGYEEWHHSHQMCKGTTDSIKDEVKYYPNFDYVALKLWGGLSKTNEYGLFVEVGNNRPDVTEETEYVRGMLHWWWFERDSDRQEALNILKEIMGACGKPMVESAGKEEEQSDSADLDDSVDLDEPPF